MTKKTRNILFLFFVLLFFVITPIASLYTAGYKFNFSWPPNLKTILQKTGMFVIETEPEGAKIFINDKIPESFFKKIFNSDNQITTPTKIKSLTPGKYDVKIELDGYWSWQKKMNIYPGQTTQIKDIKLFKKDLPIKIIDAKTQNIEISPNKKYIAFIEDNYGILLNLKNEERETFKLDENFTNKKNISWSFDGKKILIKNKIIKIENNYEMNLSQIIGDKITNIQWSQTDNNKIFYQYLDSINIFNINSQESKTIFKGEKCLDYIQDGNNLIIISPYGEIIKIKRFNIENGKIDKELDFPYSSEYNLLDFENGLIHLYDNRFKILYLIDLDSYFSPLKDVINNIRKYQWINYNTLLYNNDFEIWLYNIETKNKDLITRISKPITKVMQYPSGKYILYSTTKDINIVELDKKERRNITELIKVEKISPPQIDGDNEILYFWAKIGNQEGIYKLEI